MAEAATHFSATRRKPNPWVIVLIVLIHLAIFYGLLRALAPTAVRSVEDTVVSAFTVTVTAPPPPVPEPEPEPDSGAQGDPGREAVPKPVTAPSPRIPIPREQPAPRASSTGAANTSGASDAGSGTGRAGTGEGTGSGTGGSGQGGGIATKPAIVSGSINSARDFPTPPGGREARVGTSVIVRVTVLPSGRAADCSIYRPSPFPENRRGGLPFGSGAAAVPSGDRQRRQLGGRAVLLPAALFHLSRWSASWRQGDVIA